MTHTYHITGMTCDSCEAKVKSSFLKLPDVLEAEVSKESASAIIKMQKHIGLSDLQEALGGKDAKYQISASAHSEVAKQAKSVFETYKPVLLLLGYITIIAGIAGFTGNAISGMVFMRIFMGGFFLSFSFFKLINLKGFAESYAMYDVVAKQMPAWGYIYAFIELALGLAFATDFNPLLTNSATLIVMGVSIIGVLQSVLNKKKIQCACLGAVFNLPMSTLTIIEDLLMIVMSIAMLMTIK